MLRKLTIVIFILIQISSLSAQDRTFGLGVGSSIIVNNKSVLNASSIAVYGTALQELTPYLQIGATAGLDFWYAKNKHENPGQVTAMEAGPIIRITDPDMWFENINLFFQFGAAFHNFSNSVFELNGHGFTKDETQERGIKYKTGYGVNFSIGLIFKNIELLPVYKYIYFDDKHHTEYVSIKLKILLGNLF